MNLLLATSLALCASTAAIASDIVPMGENLYSVSKTSMGCGFGSTGKLMTAMLKDVNKFCSAKGLLPEIVTIQAEEGNYRPAMRPRDSRISLRNLRIDRYHGALGKATGSRY